jgi:hypothetical protein
MAEGLEARLATASQVSVAVSKLLPVELSARGVENADTVCAALVSCLSGMQDEIDGDSPEMVFQRLGGCNNGKGEIMRRQK